MLVARVELAVLVVRRMLLRCALCMYAPLNGRIDSDRVTNASIDPAVWH
jgi:hypothetical protein